jgi:outer membrane protein OmpA-like peptidoglycan-associated protein
MLMTETGLLTVIDASGEEIPETIVGATWFSLSQREFAELKRTGSVRHHYVQLNASGNRVDIEAITVLRREGTETARVVVNDKVAEIPVIRASGELTFRSDSSTQDGETKGAEAGVGVEVEQNTVPGTGGRISLSTAPASTPRSGRVAKGRVTALIMDDERFPFLVDYMHSMESSAQPYFRLNYATISFPDAGGAGQASAGDAGKGAGEGEMERRLAEEKRVDVYGIYFGFNSDRIRKESEPILREIADILDRNPDWTLSINGHTDNVGGDAYNLDLSRRRSEAVHKALVERFGIAADRLTTGGHGASAPKDTNDTPEGRARNRRVELVRQ